MTGQSKKRLLTERPGDSHYPDEAGYLRLQKISKDWYEPGPSLSNEILADITQLLNKENRLLDDGRFEDWLDMFVDECIYWIPGDIIAQDARKDVTWEIHDRRRLEDRVARLRTGNAYSQLPPTRTRHCITNLEAWQVTEQEIRVRCNLTLHTWSKGVRRNAIQRTLPCMTGYVLNQVNDNWLIEIKQINLIDADDVQGNNSFFL
jgi:3-phenylpropionate/cinnamic acid dioxygenase small subunit